MGERLATEGDSETNRYVVWWPMKRVKSVEPGVRDRRAVGDDQDPPDIQCPHQVERSGRRLREPWLGVPQHFGLPGLKGSHGLIDSRLLLGRRT